MRLTFPTVLKVLAALPLLAASSLSIQGQDADALRQIADEAKQARDNAADSADAKANSGSRQGYGHIRQGNTSTANDVYGRAYAPYGAESADDLLAKVRDRLQLPAWEIEIELAEPRSIEITGANGEPETVWYILFKAANRNTQTIREFKRVRTEINAGAASAVNTPRGTEVDVAGLGSNVGRPSFIDPVYTDTGVKVGMPVSTSLGFSIETLSGYNAHSTEANDLLAQITAEVDKKISSGDAEITSAMRAEMIDAEWRRARKVYNDAADADLRYLIAVKEGLMEWREGKLEPVLWSASEFKRDISPVYSLDRDALDGPIAYPEVRELTSSTGESLLATYYASVDSDGCYSGHYTKDTVPEGATLVTEGHDLFGKLLRRKYMEYDVVDRAGNPLSPSDPGYMSARAAGGEIVLAKPEFNVSGNLEQLAGSVVKRPAFRTYSEGDKVLNGWDTGVPKAEGSSETFRIYGKLLPTGKGAQAAFESAVRELRLLARSSSPNAEVPADLRAGANASMADGAVELSRSTAIFPGREAVGEQIPVKQLDHLGRAIKRELVSYKIGERVTEAEYRAWAQRFPKTVLDRHDAEEWSRPLRHGDLLVGLPKIKMGSLQQDKTVAPESVMTAEGPVPTGRIYDSRDISPDFFIRDPDGEYFTNRLAPIPAGASVSPGEAYVYAPLGPANEGAMPVPAFDRYGVWADYISPLTGRTVPLLDGNGNVVRDEMGQVLNVKAFEYEWTYAYEYERQAEEDAGFGYPFGATVAGLEMEEIPVLRNETTNEVIGIALHQIWSGEGESRKLVRLAMADSSGSVSLGAGESAVDPVTAVGNPAVQLNTASVPKYVADALRARFGGGEASELGGSHFRRAASGAGNPGFAPGIATSERWTFPAPVVVDGQAISSVKLPIGPMGERIHDHFISEKWGVIILRGVDPSWDYMNISIRGLRSPYVRQGFEPASSISKTPMVGSDMRRTSLESRWVREDWVYHARFERQGDDRKPATNSVTQVAGGWRLLTERGQ